MSRSSVTSLRSYGTSRSESTYSDYSTSESETSRLSLSWNERDARRSISTAAAAAEPVNITNLRGSEVREDPAMIDDLRGIFGQPQCQSAVVSSGYDYVVVFLLVLVIFLLIFFVGPYFCFSSTFFCIVFFIFIVLLLIAAFYSCSFNKGPVCFR